MLSVAPRRARPRPLDKGVCNSSCQLHDRGDPHIAVFPILADAVDVKKGDQLCETVSQPSIQPDKMDRPMGS